MIFDEHGYLIPYTLLVTDLETISLVFVDEMLESTTRRKIFATFIKYITELQIALDCPLEIWVDGSFTTTKLNPDDIDFVIFVDRQVAATHQQLIRQFRQRRYQTKSLMDGYFVEVVSETHPDYRIYQFNRADKHRDFAFDRLGKPKGYLQLML
ncbi:MAG: hypothetical protein H7Z72_17595 [Bacteroidetes bacterium]|nr:hypothetical protein [Fibrella sp.]